MNDLVLHELTKQQLAAFAAKPTHAAALIGPTGSGKRTIATNLAESTLGINSFTDHPYTLTIAPEDGKAIGIEAVRQLEQFLTLKVPGKTAHDRAIIIEDAHLLDYSRPKTPCSKRWRSRPKAPF